MRKEYQEKAVHGGRIRQKSRDEGRPLLDFSANLNPVPPLIDPGLSAEQLSCYPDDEYASLKEVISGVFNRPADEIAVGNGSIELIRVFCCSVLGPGDRARICPPTFGEYELSARLAGASVTCDAKEATVTFCCNPNNPTGTLRTRDDLFREYRELAAREGILFVDEAFIELSDPKESVADVREPGLFVLRSLTKAFAIPGIRFGYGFGDPDLISRIEVRRPPWSVNAYAEQYAIAAFRHFASLEESRVFIARERAWMTAGLSHLSVTVSPSAANFLLLATGHDVTSLCERLLAEGILVRDCHSFGLPGSIRVAVRTRDENRQLLEALGRCLP